ncbi:MAG: hypothetical protein QOI13_1826 [Paraburkholderia sp.]|jgi:putative heme iron utilization protein|nr:hypothetical protein [Paraburkholderia sp.]
MHIPAQAPLHLLHLSPVGTLATHLHHPEGFPYPTMLPFAPDVQHRPTILVSGLAEHTRNLRIDSRAGFLVVHEPGENVLASERVTLIGRFAAAPAAPALVRRYLRYHPEAERYLALGDFSFWVMEVERLRYIGGFGAMGWLEGAELNLIDPLSEEDEIALIANFERQARRPPWLELMGIDRYGADLKVEGVRRRFAFSAPQAAVSDLERSLTDCITSYAA